MPPLLSTSHNILNRMFKVASFTSLAVLFVVLPNLPSDILMKENNKPTFSCIQSVRFQSHRRNLLTGWKPFRSGRLVHNHRVDASPISRPVIFLVGMMDLNPRLSLHRRLFYQTELIPT